MVGSPASIWREIGPEAQRRAVTEIATWIDEHGFPSGMPTVIARALRFREATVRKARGVDLARLLQRAVPRLEPRACAALLEDLHLGPRQELLAVVLAACGLVDAPDAPGDFDGAAAQAEHAERRLLEHHSAPDALLATAVARTRPLPEAPRAALEALMQRLGARVAGGDGVVRDPAVPADAGPVAGREPAGEPLDESTPADLDAPVFTTLDRVLIRAIVSASNGVEGALDRDELVDLVEEVAALNDARARSWFHRGLLAGIRDEPLPPRAEGDNRDRRAWLLAGHFMGSLRHHPWNDVRAALEALHSADRDALLKRPGVESDLAPGVLLATELVPALLEDRALDEALAWIDVYLPAVRPDALLPAVADWAKRGLASGHPDEVRRVLERIDALLPAVERRWGEIPAEFKRLLHRRLAVTWRCEGHSAKAQQLIDALLAEAADDAERARLVGEQALIAMGLRSLETLALPDEGQGRQSFLEAVQRVRQRLEQAAGGETVVPSVLIALALPTVADPRADDAAREAGVAHLRNALEAMGRDAPGFWDRTGLDVRARFYLSLLELRELRTELAPAAVDRLRATLESDAALPFDLVREAIENALLCDAPSSIEVARLALQRWPQRLLTTLDLAELAERNVDARATLALELARRSAQLKPGERWRAWSGLLRGSLAAPDCDVKTAEHALGELEQLGHDRRFAEGFLALLEDPGRWEPAWTSVEALEARVRVLLALGRDADARAALHELTNRAISDGAADAADLVEQLKHLGAGEEELLSLRRRLPVDDPAAALPDQPEGSSTPHRPVRVLFVGGNETQARYAEGLKALVRERYAACEVEFEFSGWGPNWGALVDRLEHRLGCCHALVLMRFVRTQLGRTMRRVAGEQDKPWIPCTGHGRQSMERAIARAIEVARARAR